MIPSFLDRSAIEAHKAAFGSIERYADPDIQPMPEVVMVAIGNKMQPSKRQLASSMSLTLEPVKRVKPVEKRGPGRPRGGVPVDANAELTGRVVLERLSKGRSMAQIAVSFGVDRSTVSRAVTRAAAVDPELQAQYSGMLVCECSKQKAAHQPRCIWCRRAR